MTRAVELWIGKTDDSAIPPRVRLRVFERCDGRCHRCNRKLTPADRWSIEHVIALVNGGRHAEDNMAISCEWCKPLKDAEDVAQKAHNSRVRMRHAGVRQNKARIQSPGFQKAEKQHRATTALTPKFDGDIMALRADWEGRAMTSISDERPAPCPFCARPMKLQTDGGRKWRHPLDNDADAQCAGAALQLFDIPARIAAWNRRTVPSHELRSDGFSELQGGDKQQVGGNPSHLSVGVSDAEIIDGLIEASNQIEYLHGKFQETGSGNAVIAKLADLRHRIQSAALADGGQS
jgi:5-methylcytosine-specific restriction protein A